MAVRDRFTDPEEEARVKKSIRETLEILREAAARYPPEATEDRTRVPAP